MSGGIESVCNIDAEEGVLACCIREDMTKQSLPLVIERRIGPLHFFKPGHQVIFEALQGMFQEGIAIDEVTLGAYLQQHGNKLSEAGGYEGIMRITNRVETAVMLVEYCKILTECFQMRKLYRMLLEAMDKLKARDELAHEVAERLIRIGTGVLGDGRREASLADRIEAVMELDKQIANGERPEKAERRLYTNIQTIDGQQMADGTWLDQGFTPLDPDNEDFLIVLAGESSHGKSSLARQIGLAGLMQDWPLCYFVGESSTEKLVRQLAALYAHHNLRESLDYLRKQPARWNRKGTYMVREDGETCYHMYMEMEEKLLGLAKERKLVLNDRWRTVEDICSQARLAAELAGHPPLIVVDYLQMIDVPDIKHSEDGRIAHICRELKNLGRELKCPVLLLSSLNRQDYKGNLPTRKNLRGSGQIEFYADRIWFVVRPEKDALGHNQEDREDYQQVLIQDKHRNGPCGVKRWIVFRSTWTQYRDIPNRELRVFKGGSNDE